MYYDHVQRTVETCRQHPNVVIANMHDTRCDDTWAGSWAACAGIPNTFDRMHPVAPGAASPRWEVTITCLGTMLLEAPKTTMRQSGFIARMHRLSVL